MDAGKAIRVLVADDSPNERFFLARAFAQACPHVPVTFLRDGQEVIDHLENKDSPAPDVIVLDMKMIRASAFEVLAWLGKHDWLRQVPVIVFSSSTLPPTMMAEAMRLGATACVVKPLDFADMLAFVRSLESYRAR
jgi:CheY-like chemotaxis protein